ncbi:polysaccharide biosynthesis C-terminal domain-containing protein [Niveibacterium sp. 24ML]|uniref:oligosaccharide flippase family protein n=1 Tax=Niveibacterium sp. 24ML TaxID=2985512 RepID=UPI00226F7549|nr:polysaccharide biosynthesis C-terminal domain-containing protein [Niveibacterium sp. 24ML]MCX9154889.1 polysaccharide biosynthesis C-terminal domain-containing protein [Niveibacterium sp. 24ML]
MSLRSSLAYFAFRGASGAMAVLTVSVFARLLGPEGYAHWTLAVVLSSFVAGVLIQPIHATLARFLPRPGGAELVTTFGRLLLVAAGIVTVFALVLDALIPAWLPAGILALALALGLSQGVFDFAAQHCSSTLQARRYGRLYLFKSVVALALGYAVLTQGWGAAGAVFAVCAAYLLATAVFGRAAWVAVVRGRFSAASLPEIRAYALPVGFALLTGALLQWGDRLVLAAHVAPAQLGAYGAAGDLAQQGFGLLFSAFHLAWFPRLISAWERRAPDLQAQLDRYAQLSLLVMVPATLGFALVAHELAGALLGSAFRDDAARVMPWLALAALLGGLRTYLFDLPLHLGQRMGVQSAIAGGCALLGVTLNLLLVPRYGIAAAAAVAVLAQGCGCVASYWVGRRTLSPRWAMRDLGAVGAGALGMALAVMAVPMSAGATLLVATTLAAKVLLGGLVYALAMLAFNTAGLRTLILRCLRPGV